MRRSKTLAPGVDPVEPRVLLSSVPMVPAPPGLHGVVREVHQIVGELAQTGQVRRADIQLTRLAAQIPGGPEILAPLWRADLGMYRPHMRGSVAAVRVVILDELYGFARVGLPPGRVLPSPQPYPPRSGSPLPYPPRPSPLQPGPSQPGPTAPLVSRDSATVANDTGYALSITVRLNAPYGPYITQVLPANYGSSALFDFHSATGGFLTISIIRADGIPTPTPLTASLNMPMNGYFGTSYTVSLMGTQYFNLTPS